MRSRGVLATITLIAQCSQTFQHPLGVVHIIVNSCLNLFLTLRRINSLGSSLRDIARAVEFRALAAQPQLVQRDTFTLERRNGHFLRHDRIATTHTCESGRLRERMELDGTLPGTANLVNRAWYLWVADIGLIGGIVEDERIGSTGR